MKTSANKNAILVIAFQTPPHFTHFGWTFAVEFFPTVYHPQDVRDGKVSSALAHWEHGKRDRITTELRRISDGFFARVLSGWHSVGIPSEFRRDSIDSMDFPWNRRNHNGTRVFISPCSQCARVKLTFSSRTSWGWKTQEKNSTTKVHPKCLKCWGVWNANTRIAFLFADAFMGNLHPSDTGQLYLKHCSWIFH